MGRPAQGVRGINLAKDDEVIGMEVVGDGSLILAISELGYGKRTRADSYRLQSRGGKGVINMRVTKKTGPVIAILNVKDDSDVMLITSDGKIIRIESSQIRQSGRAAQGVRLVKMEEGDSVAAASVVPETEENGVHQEDLPLV
jgi:DNA gyrase subunit A